MSALVMEHEQAHDLRLPVEQARVEHQQAWRRDAEIGQARVEHVAHAAAAQHAACDRHRAVALQADRRGRLHGAAARARATRAAAKLAHRRHRAMLIAPLTSPALATPAIRRPLLARFAAAVAWPQARGSASTRRSRGDGSPAGRVAGRTQRQPYLFRPHETKRPATFPAYPRPSELLHCSRRGPGPARGCRRGRLRGERHHAGDGKEGRSAALGRRFRAGVHLVLGGRALVRRRPEPGLCRIPAGARQRGDRARFGGYRARRASAPTARARPSNPSTGHKPVPSRRACC